MKFPTYVFTDPRIGVGVGVAAVVMVVFAPARLTVVVALAVVIASVAVSLAQFARRLAERPDAPTLRPVDHGWAAAGEGPPGMGISGTRRDAE